MLLKSHSPVKWEETMEETYRRAVFVQYVDAYAPYLMQYVIADPPLLPRAVVKDLF